MEQVYQTKVMSYYRVINFRCLCYSICFLQVNQKISEAILIETELEFRGQKRLTSSVKVTQGLFSEKPGLWAGGLQQ